MEKKRFLKDNSKEEQAELSQERIKFKLSLRKKKYNEILMKKRIFPTKPEETPWHLELFLSKLKLPAEYKITFEKEEELIITSLNNIKSDDELNIKYGICLLKKYIEYFIDEDNLPFTLNLNFVSDLLNVLEKFANKQEKQIIFNILYLLTNYSYINKNKTISTILLSPKGYKIWEMCFDLQDYEIMSQMVWILSNITYDDKKSAYNLLKSNFFQKKIFYFYSNPTIIGHLNETKEDDIFYILIERGLNIFNNILSVESSSTYNKEEIYKKSMPILNLILKYSDSNNQKIFDLCIYSISKAIDNENRLISLIDNSNLINDILNKKFFTNEKTVLYCNRVLGDYLQSKTNLEKSFYDKCINYEIDIIFSFKLSSVLSDCFWVLSNILHDYMGGEAICQNEAFINHILNLYKSSIDYKCIKEMNYFFRILCYTINVNTFIKLENKGLVDIVLGHVKNTFDEPKSLKILLDLIRSFLDTGYLIEENFGGKNIIKEKCDNYGLNDLLRKYENTLDDELADVIEKIMVDYYS